jgi:hypothetical protein
MRLLLESRWPGAFFQPIPWRRLSPVSCGVLYNSRWELFRPVALAPDVGEAEEGERGTIRLRMVSPVWPVAAEIDEARLVGRIDPLS